MATDTFTVRANQTTATQIVWAGEGPVLIVNTDLVQTISISEDNAARAGDATGIVPIGPNGSVSVDGTRDFYAVTTSAAPVTIATISGGINTFLGLTQGSGNLVLPSVQSPNFVHDVSGWQIAKNGNAEFNSITLRGTFAGTNYIINANGAFFYSGTPAIGNLVASISNQSGAVDPPGNNILAGNTTYFFNGSVYIAEQCNGPSTIWWTAATENGAWTQIGSISGSPSVITISGSGSTNPVVLQGSQISLSPFLLLANQGSPPSGFSNFGTLYANGNGVPSGVTDVGAFGAIPLTKAIQGGNTNNTTSFNAMFTPFPITGFDMAANTAIRIHCGGHGTQAATTATTLNWRVVAFGLNWGSSTDTGNVPAGATFHWDFMGVIILGAATNNAPASFFGRMTISQAVASAQDHTTAMDTQVASGVDTTANTNITLQAAWTSVVNNPTLVCTGATYERFAA